MKKINFSQIKAGAVIPYLILVIMLVVVAFTGHMSLNYIAAYRSTADGGDGARVAMFKVESKYTEKNSVVVEAGTDGAKDVVNIDNTDDGHELDWDWDSDVDELKNNYMTYTFQVQRNSETAINSKLYVEAYRITDGAVDDTPSKLTRKTKLALYRGTTISDENLVGTIDTTEDNITETNIFDLGDSLGKDDVPKTYTLLIWTTDTVYYEHDEVLNPVDSNNKPTSNENELFEMKIWVQSEQID